MNPKIILELGALVAMVVGAISYFETHSGAVERETRHSAEHEALAGDREIGDLRTRLRLNDIELDSLRRIGAQRPLTDDEEIELRALEAERKVLLERLANLGQL